VTGARRPCADPHVAGTRPGRRDNHADESMTSARRPCADSYVAGTRPGRGDSRADESMTSARQPYADPYLAGAGLGLVLLAALVITGRGLGASGAFATTAAGLVQAVAPGAAAANPYFARYLAADGPWRDWLLVELAGVALGGLASAWLAGRLGGAVERGPRLGARPRLLLGFAGGAIMGLGAVLARGCTSGLALTGGALLSAGAWGFMLAAFAGAYLTAPVLRRAWR
jgi:uncharacterized membrane protein YedE/YeeE